MDRLRWSSTRVDVDSVRPIVATTETANQKSTGMNNVESQEDNVVKKYLQSNSFHVSAHIVVVGASVLLAALGQLGVTPSTHDSALVEQIVAVLGTLGLTAHLNEVN